MTLQTQPHSYIKSLFLKDFRSYHESYFEFHPKINYIFGRNAIGKTNLLEGIFLISTGKSFRTSLLSELIRADGDAFFLKAVINRQGVDQDIELYCTRSEKSLRLNATEYKTFSPLLGILPHVISTSTAIQFIEGGPSERRRFLDFHLAQSDSLYVHHYLRFFKAMKNRNTLLRATPSLSKPGTLDIWNELFIASASYLLIKRKEMIERLTDRLSKISIKYKPCPAFQDAEEISKKIRNRLHALYNKELDVGYTLTGPHRDDMSILIDGKEAKTFASEGQKRLCLTAIRLAEWDTLLERTEIPPILSIDDFGAYLDRNHQEELEEKLQGFGQVFLCSPHGPHPSFRPHLLTIDVADKHALEGNF
jgi:DNA replication and repair protein RecF